MPGAAVGISGPAGEKTTTLNPQGSTLGRGRMCDIMLNHESVSRLHARIFRDPSGDWKIEDLGSHNGIIIEGKRVTSQALIFGQKFEIACFTLTFQEDTRKPEVKEALSRTLMIGHGQFDETVITYRPEPATVLGAELLPAFNSFTENLMKMSDSAELYEQACRRLEESIQGFVAILRLPVPVQPRNARPEVLACRVANEEDPHEDENPRFRFSQSVLEAVGVTEEPVMTHSHPASHQDLALTVVNNVDPRVVFAAPVNITGDAIDLLYVDLPEERMSTGMFDFIEAVSRQISFVQKNLFFEELRRANRELKEKDRIKDEYVSRITHDIKGHLGAIKSCLAVVDEKSGIGSPEKKAEFLDRASRRTTQLLTFIADLLRITKLRLSGQMEVKTFSLKEAITRSLETVAPGATDKRINLEADVDPAIGTMTGDELSITEVITNLLFNAIKYSPENESVSLKATIQNDQFFIAISDTGIGIPDDEIDQVFDEFFRASNAIAFEKDGTGLGLALVKQIVQRHGGTITAENNSGKGAVFSILLPLDVSSAG